MKKIWGLGRLIKIFQVKMDFETLMIAPQCACRRAD